MTTSTPSYNHRPPLWTFLRGELKARGPVFTPFNMITGVIVLVSLAAIAVRFVKGLASITNLNQAYPWGIWIGFDVMTGVAFAGGAYIITCAVYVLHAERFHPIVRPTVLNGFLSYLFYAGALFLDLGRPWHMINPIIGNSFGYNSILFLVAWHFLLYMASEAIEFSPVVAEWLGLERARSFLSKLTLVTVIFGVTLSMLHQSGLGALFLFCASKIHPLWYTEFLPLLFLVSSIFAGLSMIIFEGTISHRVFRTRIDPNKHASFEEIVVSLAKGAAVSMYVYLFFKILVFVHGQHWNLLLSKWGAWYAFEVIGLVAIPCALFTHGYQKRRVGAIRIASVLTLLGIIINRLNVSVIAFNWNNPATYFPSIYELLVTLMVVSIEIWVFRWVVYRMPVLQQIAATGRN